MADPTVVVSWDRGAKKLVATPDPLKMEKNKRNVKITWEPGDAVKSVDDVNFSNDQFFDKKKHSNDGTVTIKDKNSVGGKFKYDIAATRRDGAAETLDPFVENDPGP